MPMFYTPKPRQFHYNPRYYDPEREKWENIKRKYGYTEDDEARLKESSDSSSESGDAELKYFEEKVRAIERKERREVERFGLKDLFRKREMPKFNYTPRYQNDGALKEDAATYEKPKTKIKIGRRFDFDDEDYMKPVSGGRILVYTLVVCLLLYWIILK